jgi:hypothetical protein
LKPQAGQRQTACIRYISAAPHRSQIILPSLGAAILIGEIGRAAEARRAGASFSSSLAVSEGGASAMAAIIAREIRGSSKRPHCA